MGVFSHIAVYFGIHVLGLNIESINNARVLMRMTSPHGLASPRDEIIFEGR